MIKNVMKGIIIGLANIIPGVSGGTLAVSMGIYDKLIHCITHLFSELKNNILFLFPIMIGMGIAIVGSTFGIDFLFKKFPMETNFLFIGLIVGSLPPVYNKVKGNTVKKGHIISAFVFFAIVVGLALLNEQAGASVELTTSIFSLTKLFIVGVIAAATMVIPGVSGSMMLLLLGYYNPILGAIKSFIVSVFSMNINGIIDGIFILTPFGIGVIVGIFAIAKIIEVIFEKYPDYAYWSIIGLIVASPIAILLIASLPQISIIRTVVSIVTFACGFFISTKLGEN